MAGGTHIAIATLADALVHQSSGDLHISRRVVRREHGSDSMSLNVTTIHEGFEDSEPVTYDGFDEIVYVLAGEAEAEFDGEWHRLHPGSALIIPDGCAYRYRVISGPNEIIAVYSPARF